MGRRTVRGAPPLREDSRDRIESINRGAPRERGQLVLQHLTHVYAGNRDCGLPTASCDRATELASL